MVHESLSIANLARPATLAIEPYAWEASSDAIAARYGLDPRQVVRFDTNTAPLPPECYEEVLERVRALPLVQEYFDGSYAALADALHDYLGFSPEHMVIGAGADEVIDVLAKTFLDPGDSVVIPAPTYSLYRIVAHTMGATIQILPSREDLRFDVDALIQAAVGAKAVFLCNPNNPTGFALPVSDVLRLVRGIDGLLIVDEAYAEFTGESAVPFVRQEPRLIVVRTLSKAFALAGARIGYAIATPEVAALANRMRPPNSISYISAVLGETAVRQRDAMRRAVATIAAEREWFAGQLRALGIEVLPSVANFLLTRWPSEQTAAQVHEATLARGLVLRSYAGHPVLGAHLRMTVRTRAQNEALLAVLREVGAPALV
jgi:histidinol-phosphate aminotransferase